MKDKPEANRISRRRFIQSGAAASLGLLLVGCGDDEVAGALARPMNDYLFVMTLPKPVP